MSALNESLRSYFRSGMARQRHVCIDCGRFFLTLNGAVRHGERTPHIVIHHSMLKADDLVGRSFMGVRLS